MCSMYPSRSRAYSRRTSSGVSTKTVSPSVKKYVKRVIASDVETKQYQTAFGKVNSVETGDFYDLTNMAQGVTEITRLGDNIKLVGLDFNVLFEQTTGGDDSIRCILFKWHGDTTTAGPLLNRVLSPATSADRNIIAPPSFSQPGNFTILWDKMWSTGLTGGSPTQICEQHRFRGKKWNFKVNFTNNQVTGTQHLHLLVLSTVSSGADLQFSFNAVVHFEDA